MQYIGIKKENKEGKTYYIVSAMRLNIKNSSSVQKIPHPMGSDSLVFDNIEEAKSAITRAGFLYILPDGRQTSNQNDKFNNVEMDAYNLEYDKIVLNAIMDKIDSSNMNVVASAISALCEFPSDRTFDILFEKIGEDNELIRKNAIDGICRYGNLLQDRIIKALNSKNWIEKHSALSCISNLADSNSIEFDNFIIPLTKACMDSNTIVQAFALSVLAKVYQKYKNNK